MHTPDTPFKKNLLCFSHLRWNFVFQRPQHLLTRLATYYTVYFIEEPVYDATTSVFYESRMAENADVHILTPHLQPGATATESIMLRLLLDDFFDKDSIAEAVCWYYTPMALAFSAHLQPACIVYDCMDELSAFKGAPAGLKSYERQLLQRADLVFTGGHKLYEEKKKQRSHNIYPFPSSIDKAHFAQARQSLPEPADQAGIPHPRLGFFGVIDERLDIAMLDEIARQRPYWQLVLIGPVVKIDPATLPSYPNVHYPGMKDYRQLPAYIAGWDIALIPFAINESTAYISPTKTPEYLAAGKRVISSPITDVVKPYGDMGLVEIAHTADEWIEKAEWLLQQSNNRAWLQKTDAYLSMLSWDDTVAEILGLIESHLINNNIKTIESCTTI